MNTSSSFEESFEDSPVKNKSKDLEDEKIELSDEDKQLKDELTMLVERLQDSATELYHPSLETMAKLIKASTTSMTSVPKPLKFMRSHFDSMKKIHQKLVAIQKGSASAKLAAEIISVLAMTMGGGKECLVYRLLCEDDNATIGEWGHEYVRHLSAEIASNWPDTTEDFKKRLIALVYQIVPYNMAHNAEAEACDLLMEIERLDLLGGYVDESAYPRVCLYLQSCVPYVPEPENISLLKCALKLSRKFEMHTQAMRLAMMINDMPLIQDIFTSCNDLAIQKQLAFMLGRQQIFLELAEGTNDYDDLVEIMSNSHLNNHFLNLARELDIMEPKTPEDVYKSHLDNSRTPFGSSQIDSARQNLAASFVNGFVNAGFGQDKLLMEDGNKWLYKNKEHGMLSATASLGLILLWDVDGGLTPIDKYLYSNEDYIKSGALLACGIVNCGVRNEVDPALALLSDYVLHQNSTMRIGSILGLGLAYAGSNRSVVLELIGTVFSSERRTGSTMEVMGIAALSLGMIAVGSCNSEVTEVLLQTIMDRSELELKDTYARFLPLGLGLVYLGRQEAAEAVIAALEIIQEPFRSMATTMVEICAYAGTGNVLKIQQLLHLCSEHYEPAATETESSSSKKDTAAAQKEKEDKEKDLSACQSVAVLGIALIAMGEEIGSEMAFRSFGNLLRYCEPCIRRAVPLALGLISVSNPKLNILDTLSKFSHDSDAEVAHNAIFAMGLVGAGTNNARLAAMLRQLAQYHAKDPNNLFMVRIAQGLTHLGKGTLTLSPYHSDRQLMSPVAVGGLMATLVSFLDVKNIILGKSHYLLYTLATAMQPRMLITFTEDLSPCPVPVRVGMAVDVVGQAGKPKTITGFQTHTTPVLLAMGERAELATEEYISLTPIMEGFCILRKNPNYVP
ncbi:26S proteasome non-ATPase regulatory subunit 2 [Toxorhynchites rutilus septentrionalis]|uniref:26S proteasome non-ATPase regulatory subunit 2 n=1 Tax=Toxorhynchites rutilus septentrionalis TaxID=329112 RepID=UPI00247A5CC8|nr:26S proteasome non-ATPase regulatory subunit 2 [Toxorhynchites rutilus septentrionalis]